VGCVCVPLNVWFAGLLANNRICRPHSVVVVVVMVIDTRSVVWFDCFDK